MSDRVIQLLPASQFRTFDGWLDSEDRHVNPVFRASFQHPEYGLIPAYCKVYKPENSNRGLINEIIGFLYGDALNVPQPKHAFIAQVPRSYLTGLAKLGKLCWLNQRKDSEFLVFGTSTLDGRSAAIHFSNPPESAQVSKLISEIANWQHYPHAIAVDENIAHVDRHCNNLIRLNRNSFALIDNGRLVNELDESWTASALDHNLHYSNRLAEMLEFVPTNQTSNIISSSIGVSSKHPIMCVKITDELAYWIDLLVPQSDGEAMKQFLLKRNEATECLLRTRYNRLV